jgi:hypothetical protein
VASAPSLASTYFLSGGFSSKQVGDFKNYVNDCVVYLLMRQCTHKENNMKVKNLPSYSKYINILTYAFINPTFTMQK